MGCGISKFNINEDGPPCSNFLRRTNRAITDGNPSTKLLLRDVGEEYLLVDSNDVSHKRITVVPSSIPKNEVLSTVKNEDYDGETEKLDGHQKIKERDVIRTMEDEDEDEEEEIKISDYDGPLFMASPSFRTYCVGCDSDDSVKDGDGNTVVSEKEKKIQIKDCNAPLNSNEGTPTGSGKKWSGGRRFRKVFPMGRQRPATVKNLLQVTTCYKPVPPPLDRPEKSLPSI